MNDEHSSMVMNAINHEAHMAGYAIQCTAVAYERPSIMLRPKIYIDGDKWCALYGENIQDGVAGFGDSPAKAFEDFDKNFHLNLEVSDGET